MISIEQKWRVSFILIPLIYLNLPKTKFKSNYDKASPSFGLLSAGASRGRLHGNLRCEQRHSVVMANEIVQ
jgi:hypothetical protein